MLEWYIKVKIGSALAPVRNVDIGNKIGFLHYHGIEIFCHVNVWLSQVSCINQRLEISFNYRCRPSVLHRASLICEHVLDLGNPMSQIQLNYR